MNGKYLILINVFVLNYYSFVFCDETEGIDIQYLNSSIACSGGKPLVFNGSYGYIETQNFNGIQPYPSNSNCSWLLIGNENHSYILKFLSFELDPQLRDGLYLYNGCNETSTLVKRLSGSIRKSTELIFPTNINILFIRFIGLPNPNSTGFVIYFQKNPLRVECSNTQIKCRNGYKCTELKNHCNGVDDCGDGTDEQNCAITFDKLNFKNKCGNPQIKPIEKLMRIVGGYPAKPGSWPWMVDMRIVEDEPYGHRCGASVLNRQWIMTAAHCYFYNKNPFQWKVVFGKYQKLVSDLHEITRYVDKFFVHPDYSGQPKEPNITQPFDRATSDLALVRLNAPLPIDNPYISSICLPQFNKELNPTEMLWVTGWGLTYDTGNDLVLKQTKIPVISNKLCHQWMPGFSENSSAQICAAFEEGGQDSCNGDSGGPLVRRDPETQDYQLFGIVSNGGVCGGKKQAGVYTKVSHFVSWIKSIIFQHK